MQRCSGCNADGSVTWENRGSGWGAFLRRGCGAAAFVQRADAMLAAKWCSKCVRYRDTTEDLQPRIGNGVLPSLVAVTVMRT